jgi:hypothetical protein
MPTFRLTPEPPEKLRDHRLVQVKVRVRRAKEQFDALNREFKKFTEGEPHRYIRKLNLNPPEVRFHFEQRATFPVDWGVKIGEIAHNLHSALDHFIWQAVFHETGKPPTNIKLAFPIYLSRVGFEKNAAPKTKGLSAATRALIQEVQPFVTGKNAEDPLWHLHQLSIHDKHHSVSFAATIPTKGVLTCRVLPTYVRSIGLKPLEDKAEVFAVGYNRRRFSTPASFARMGMDVDAEFTTTIAFRQPPELYCASVIDVLRECGSRVSEVLNSIEPQVFGLP